MPRVFDDADMARLSAPHVSRAWLVEFDLPTGPLRLHSGVGTVTVDGLDWAGVADPFGARLLSLGTIEEPRFGAAAAITALLSGVDLAFLRSVWASRATLRGAAARVWFQMFDGETQRTIGPRVELFPKGKVAAPKISREGIGVRTLTLTIEGIWAAANFALGGRWTPADQKRRYPGDKGLDFCGVEIAEQWK